jgi:hypothetical protein
MRGFSCTACTNNRTLLGVVHCPVSIVRREGWIVAKGQCCVLVAAITSTADQLASSCISASCISAFKPLPSPPYVAPPRPAPSPSSPPPHSCSAWSSCCSFSPCRLTSASPIRSPSWWSSATTEHPRHAIGCPPPSNLLLLVALSLALLAGPLLSFSSLVFVRLPPLLIGAFAHAFAAPLVASHLKKSFPPR